jgi:hypothetical protein
VLDWRNLLFCLNSRVDLFRFCLPIRQIRAFRAFWPLYGQFGAGYSRLRDFRADFIGGLDLALAAYPDARVAIGERGVILRPSRPAVASKA